MLLKLKEPVFWLF